MKDLEAVPLLGGIPVESPRRKRANFLGLLAVSVALALAGVATFRSHRGTNEDAMDFVVEAEAAVDTLSIDCDSPIAELVCKVTYSAHGLTEGATYSLLVEYRRTSENPLHTAGKKVIANSKGLISGSLHLFRLRALAPYTVVVRVIAGSGVVSNLGSTQFTAPAFSGGDFFDGTMPYGNASGTASFDLLMMGASIGGSNGFRGLVVLDTDGYIVWGYPQMVICNFAPLSDNNIAIMSTPLDADDKPGACSHTSELRTNADNHTVTSRLLLIHPTGVRVAEHQETCKGAPTNWKGVTHELWADDESDDASGPGIITIQSNIVSFDSDVIIEKEPHSKLRADRVVRWRPELSLNGDDPDEDDTSTAGALEPVVELMAHWTPSNGEGDGIHLYLSDTVYDLETFTCDDGNRTNDVVYWMHASGATTATNPKGKPLVIVSLRNLNTVAAFRADDGALEWTLTATKGGSGQIPSNFTFAGSSDPEFYQPHSPRLLRGGSRLMVIDDGTSRPGCAKGTQVSGDDTTWQHVKVQCYSRAIAYDLDYTTMTATVVWQFEYPIEDGDDDGASSTAWRKEFGMYNSDGGTVAPLSKTNRILAAFGALYDNAREDFEDRKETHVFELDVAARKRSSQVKYELQVPRPSWAEGNYRVMAIDSVAGERTVHI